MSHTHTHSPYIPYTSYRHTYTYRFTYNFCDTFSFFLVEMLSEFHRKPLPDIKIIIVYPFLEKKFKFYNTLSIIANKFIIYFGLVFNHILSLAQTSTLLFSRYCIIRFAWFTLTCQIYLLTTLLVSQTVSGLILYLSVCLPVCLSVPLVFPSTIWRDYMILSQCNCSCDYHSGFLLYVTSYFQTRTVSLILRAWDITWYITCLNLCTFMLFEFYKL